MLTRHLSATGRSWVTNSALAVLGLALIAFCFQGVSEIHHYTIGFGLVAMYQALIYLVAGWVILNHQTNRWTLPIIVAIAFVCRVVCVFSPPFLSTDIYRYVWDGWVQAAHINPFRYIPADSHLAFLRDGKIYPHINRRDYAHTIYPPGAEFLFLLITRISGSIVWMKACMTAIEMTTIWVLIRLLPALALNREYVLLYAWHPLLIWEVASSGHVDAAALPLIALALLFYVRNRPVATGMALAGAVLIKLYPIAFFPALYRRSALARRDFRMPGAMLGLIVLAYACYASVGVHVVGFMSEYAKEEGLESGSRYFLFTALRHALGRESLPTGAFYGFAALLLGGLALWAFVRSERSPMTAMRFAFLLATVLMLLFSAHYPWYYLWLLPLLSVIAYTPMIYFLIACFYLYTTSLANPGPAMYYMFQWLYVTTALVALWSGAMRWAETRRAEFALHSTPVRNS
jgi:alpha-1,6-mannosyltransferase